MNATTSAALYTFAAHYHSGQWSRGYRLLCYAERAWQRRTGIGPRLDYWERVLDTDPAAPLTLKYHYLATRYGGSV
jgi:hypothetical protein